MKVLIKNSMSKIESEKVVSVSSRGQATVPKEFREELSIDTPSRVKFVRTEKGDIVVRPIDSVTDLRGILEGKTDEQGRSATDRLHEERAADTASEFEIQQSPTRTRRVASRPGSAVIAPTERVDAAATAFAKPRMSSGAPLSSNPVTTPAVNASPAPVVSATSST